ncbi:hypothetical protein BIFPSEUDO_04119 [Bifidobacterium pseudocatenulatum DSM 20438 = JCM 1200 = LMG 10505]|uniref:Uncharacterized protein n=1 Tax=Bifidobacterium pseudocatenulatum DSM 20438 = JCM 1200 = LMG 10505 TaxID=547043 RepID=C0BUN2_BIFPS|nr:hypothetical protein BIFPSEUDO_04119 [Bifidobacterium pseudocatenulatum DSM 20438 = JCM 1200 = LMG 10505]
MPGWLFARRLGQTALSTSNDYPSNRERRTHIRATCIRFAIRERR